MGTASAKRNYEAIQLEARRTGRLSSDDTSARLATTKQRRRNRQR